MTAFHHPLFERQLRAGSWRRAQTTASRSAGDVR
jgi:hypothetical protein